ncbi:hypothetical protein N7L96_01860 [Mammaliicoccus sciuri]|uniref:hypothetical protein n=1 Tax=Mammaliicoccus sciuri TaxID=1296 RepID=UPI001FB25B46|nr:hypothetical protein [Mammaliicoccus sciuri]MCJ1765852.1 hypothetical protein [Mammaliicoccus sciuri]MDC5693333.1 hypothetical protein [Mammaliicoccus sciuri]
MKRYVVEVQGSYVHDVHLRGATISGRYRAEFTPKSEKLDFRNVWITKDFKKAMGVAYLVDGVVHEFKE